MKWTAECRALVMGERHRRVKSASYAKPRLFSAIFFGVDRPASMFQWQQSEASLRFGRKMDSLGTQPDAEAAVAVSASQRRLVFAGLMLALALAALDQNIVGTALPRIVGDLGGLAHLSWVVTAFLLTSTATTPLYGKLSDMYGRRPLFFAAIVIFLLGSVLCGLSRTMTELILFRGLQGLGAGGLFTLSQTTVADLVAPRERGRYQGLFASVFAVSSVAGPLLGGFITDVLSWRWIFYVNLPVGAAALGLIAIGLHRERAPVAHRIDYAGAVLLTAATSSMLLVLSWGGTLYPWASAVILGLAAISVLLFVLLIVCERRAAEPVLPPHLFANRVFFIAAVVTSLTAMALIGANVFLPLFFQLVLGASPSHAGLMIAPLMGGLILSSTIGGRLVSATGRYKIFAVIGLATAALAYSAMAYAATAGADTIEIETALAMLGAGIGLVMPNLTTAIQNAVARNHLGVATATNGFFRSLGGSFGVGVSGALMTGQLHRALPAAWTEHVAGGRSVLEGSVEQIANLPAPQRDAIIEAYRHAITTTFLAGAAVAAVAFIVVLFLPEKPLMNKRGT
jgi:EmrB/QacA subfamily drug resistance transporter